jgi:hypothetical protein
MSEKNDGGPVHSRVSFKNQYGHPVPGHKGITRRDWLAGLAMQGILGESGRQEKIRSEVRLANDSGLDTTMAKATASLAYELADAMIAEGDK